MSGEEPIDLPALSAQRMGPCAAVCTSGHVFAWFVDGVAAANFCAKCGDPIITACPVCQNGLPADAEMLQWVPYHAHCMSCGNAYPWRADDVARAKRALAERAEVDGWSDSVKARADELVNDIAAERAVPSEVVAALHWLAQHGAESASATILDAVERLADANLKQALRPTFPGLF